MVHSAAKRALRPALLACCLAQGRAQVIVTPRCPTLHPGQSCAFEARLAPDPAAGPEEARWRWTLPGEQTGSLHPDTGVYTAPEVTEVLRVRVRASRSDDPLVSGEATATILPGEPFALVDKVLGPDWLAPFSTEFPFMDLATGQRFRSRGWVWEHGTLRSTWRTPVLTGCGLPCTLRWHAQPHARAELLSYREGDEVVQRDVTGQDAQEITPRSPVAACEVESLQPLAGLDHSTGVQPWRSQVQRLPVDVRGVFPFAGNTVAEGGHADGKGLAARFREPFDLIRVPTQDSFFQDCWDLVVTDPRSHVLRRISLDGRVTTFSGQEGEAGHRDSPGMIRSLVALFCRKPAPVPLWNRPTFLARHGSRGSTRENWGLQVSDSGNHVIRRVHPGGTVETAAGTPCLAGHRDSDDPLEAQFNDPRGIAMDGASTFVADRGNFVIRRISATGAVSTLAGSPGLSGTQDGTGGAARFTDLKGLAWHYQYGRRSFLLALDGHAMRKITSPEGVVTTVLGQVDTPGFLDIPGPGAAPGPEAGLALLQPCLNDPTGIRSWDGILHIADRGNHALRKLDLGKARLTTIAGAPELTETRWGLLRDGIPGPLDARYAALAAPTAVTSGPQGPEVAQFVCTGRGLAQVRHGEYPRDTAEVTQLDCFPARRNEPVVVYFSVRTLDRHGEPTVQPFHYHVDFIESDGTLAERRSGSESTARAVTLEGVFTQAGTAIVVLRAVTAQGVSTGMKRMVQVQDELCKGTEGR